jgi:hypothetical protein
MSAKNSTPMRTSVGESERDARRLGWFAGAPMTWREYLEQYPYGAAEIAKAREAISHAA